MNTTMNLNFFSNQDESASVAIRTVELDELVLGGAAVQYREVSCFSDSCSIAFCVTTDLFICVDSFDHILAKAEFVSQLSNSRVLIYL